MAIKTVFSWNKPYKKIENDLGFSNRFDIYVAETSARYMNKYVPFLNGPLSQTYRTGRDSESGYVEYIQPYAHRQYNGIGFNFTTEFHPLATDHWDKYMLLADGNRMVSEINGIRKRYSK